MHRIGIILGRLSPLIEGKIQAFPAKTWREEFAWAREDGFELLEWVVDSHKVNENPLLSSQGRKEIKALKEEFQIEIPSICADYFMEFPLTSSDTAIRLKSLGMLTELIRICPEVGIRYIECPLIGPSSIVKTKDEEDFKKTLSHLLPLLEKNQIEILMEVDLSPERVADFYKDFPSDHIQINYDMGNSVYWKFDVSQEMSSYGNRIANIHVKDCTPERYSVPLGQGHVDFEKTFKLLKKHHYQGDFILQTARGKDHRKTAQDFRNFTRNLIQEHFNGS